MYLKKWLPVLDLCRTKDFITSQMDNRYVLTALTKRRSFTQFILALLFIISSAPLAFSQDSTAAASASGANAEQIAQGKELFMGNCASCHDPKLNKGMTGPALGGLLERREREWAIKWIRNNAELRASGDKIANQVFEENGGKIMNAFDWMSEEELDAVLAYIEAGPYEEEVTSITPATPSGDPGTPQQSGDNTLILGLIVMVLLLIVAVLFLMAVSLNKQLKEDKELDEADKEIVNQKFNVFAILKHPAFIGAVALIVVLIGVHTLLYKGAYAIGVQTGYAPTQEIPFSHKIHAGQYKIDCNYCHTGVTKSKHANIPSPNICMNCHAVVKTESEEIAKIHKAMDYDKETGKYGPNKRPIVWTRVHNLPDLAYFNHAQHVNVAELECQTCHGPIEEMDIVRQHSTLTMGWCITCHKNTEVNIKGNDYYDAELVEQLKQIHKGRLSPAGNLTVENIGGWECSKCHY